MYRERSTQENADAILEVMALLGSDADEGLMSPQQLIQFQS
jgi:hypothetical protein